ncbi:hypothetical protein ONZ43_g4785 [Nemania bipapillata]|uniref:Uncharacterized protein n=1 Tax=Nemania bipapillata TaxID=110536 RepID=A0ACC2II97_9PEZI|nr:hypothetical protein ONZ43_g4785 [Nemania bipapillata]
MGKAKTSKRGNSGSGPYERPSKKNATANNVFKFTKDLGQHILKNPGIAQAIVDKAYLKPTDVVLEVGPGTGNLTVQIVNQARKVIAVEMDPRMAAEVTKRLQGRPEQKKLEVILGDVIKQDPLPDHDSQQVVMCLHLEYALSDFKPPRIQVITITDNVEPPRTCILMFQREFAMRLTAQPGDSLYCRLSVNAQLWAKISHVLKVGRANLIETNYRLFCATHDIPIDEGLVDDAEEDEEMEVDENDNDASMDVDGDDDMPSFFGAPKIQDGGAPTSKRGSLRKTRIAVLVKEKVRKVLEETQLAESRSAKMHENDFLSLLAAFNAEGIHFS